MSVQWRNAAVCVQVPGAPSPALTLSLAMESHMFMGRCCHQPWMEGLRDILSEIQNSEVLRCTSLILFPFSLFDYWVISQQLIISNRMIVWQL